MAQYYLVDCYRDDAAPLSDGSTTIGFGLACASSEEQKREAERFEKLGWTVVANPWPVDCIDHDEDP